MRWPWTRKRPSPPPSMLPAYFHPGLQLTLPVHPPTGPLTGPIGVTEGGVPAL